MPKPWVNPSKSASRKESTSPTETVGTLMGGAIGVFSSV